MFLASDDAAFITGQTITVNGGLTFYQLAPELAAREVRNMKRFRVIDAEGHCQHDSQIAECATYMGRSLRTADRSCFSHSGFSYPGTRRPVTSVWILRPFLDDDHVLADDRVPGQ